jgi:hypothetical protein
MRTTVLILAAALTGCASQSTPAPRAEATLVPRALPTAPSAVALAFTPPIAADLDDLGLDRDGRQTVAYAGYERQVVSTTYTRQDDRQRSIRGGYDQSFFERRSISTTVTVRGN